MNHFAIGRVQSVAAAGEPCVHPSVRRGGLPGRRSQASKTQWALSLISTVRIGAGAGQTPDTQNAATPMQQTSRKLF